MVAAPAWTAPRVAVDIPAGTLANAIITLAEQTNVTVGTSDPALARLATPAVRGTITVDQALARLLRGLPAHAEPVDGRTWRIVAAMRVRHAPARRAPPACVAAAGQDEDIVVTGSKTGTRVDRYAGTVTVVAGSGLNLGEQGIGSDALVQRMPTLASTNLGAGRNKLFIRGVADSSFNGPSQAVVGQYLGDVRLNYNAPDPDLSLYDVKSVEVIEGPQGTLYGVGALGGIVRIVPQPVDMAHFEGAVALDRSTTAHGAGGHDVVAIANVPLIAAKLALRVVAFDTLDGGYIDDSTAKRSNINRTTKRGGRATLDYRPGDWRVEAGLVTQDITSSDGQYAERGLPPLTRSQRVAQPFDNDYLLTSLTVSRDWGATSFVSASAYVNQNVDSLFDFTRAGAASPRVFDQRNHINLFSNETRVSRRDGEGAGWVAGFSLLHDNEQLTRALGAPAAPVRILGLSNSVTEAAIFGEAGRAILPDLVATVGGRLAFAHLVGHPLDRAADVGEPHRNELAILPSLSLSWRFDPRLSLFARYQEGLRPGGLSITPGSGAPVVQRFHGDTLASLESGIKFASRDDERLDASISAFYTHWENIQADLVNANGLPYTANIGSGHIGGVEAQLRWRPLARLDLAGALFASSSRLTSPAPGIATAGGRELPNVAHLGMTATADYRQPLAAGWQLDLTGSARYFGHSRLGIEPELYLRQGGYWLCNAAARLGTARFGFSLQADNVMDRQANSFALGNPFGVTSGRQIVPLRPRTVRLIADARF